MSIVDAIREMPNERVQYRRARDAADAVAAVADRPEATFLAGGTNLVDHMRLGIAELLVDASRLPLDSIESLPDGRVRIGATVHNSDLAAEPVIRRRYPVLSRALLAGASGQLRNLGTTPGNLRQRTRCVYFQDLTTPCNKRDPGTGCSALHGYNRHHAILGASASCVAVHPSDMAVAMTALDGVVDVQGARGPPASATYPVNRMPGSRAWSSGTAPTRCSSARPTSGREPGRRCRRSPRMRCRYRWRRSTSRSATARSSVGVGRRRVVLGSRAGARRSSPPRRSSASITATVPPTETRRRRKHQNADQNHYAMHAFGAQFAEVRAHPGTGEDPRIAAAGNVRHRPGDQPQLARSQLIGGMTMGMGMALHENSVTDPRFGHVVNHDLAEHHLPANADVRQVQGHWLDGHDSHTNPMGSRALGRSGSSE